MCTVFQLSTAEKTEKEEQERNQHDPAHVAKKTKTDHKGASKQQCGKTRKKIYRFLQATIQKIHMLLIRTLLPIIY